MNIIDQALANPGPALDELKKLDCEDSLIAFVIEMWEELEPGTPLVLGWVMYAICEALEQVEEGNIKRLLINVPPGFMKSMLVSVFFPAWLWGPRNRPESRIISTSYAQDLAVRDNRRARELIESEKYQRWWGDRFAMSGDQNAKIRYENTKRGFRQAASTGSALTGHRGDGLIVDDPHSVESAESEADRNTVVRWYGETLPTRFNNQKDGWLIVIMQRVHQQDVSGFILGEGEGENALSGYVHLMVPMEFESDRKYVIDLPTWHWEDPRTEEGELAWKERFDRDDVEKLKEVFRKSGGEYAVAGQLAQNPVPRVGGQFQREDFQIIDAAPEGLSHVCRGWDLAATKDGFGAQTAGVKIATHQGKTYILDALAGRWGANEVVENIKTCVSLDGHSTIQSIPQDPGQAGKAQRVYMASNMLGADLHFSPESGSKEDRARPLSAQCQAGNVYLVRGAWNDSLINEFCAFPAGKLKDQVDAASRAFHWLTANEGDEMGAAPEII